MVGHHRTSQSYSEATVLTATVSNCGLGIGLVVGLVLGQLFQNSFVSLGIRRFEICRTQIQLNGKEPTFHVFSKKINIIGYDVCFFVE